MKSVTLSSPLGDRHGHTHTYLVNAMNAMTTSTATPMMRGSRKDHRRMFLLSSS
jgi:hypothetical protein